MTRPAVDVGSSGARLILGLGNPGDRYRDTRHNVGFRAVEALAQRRGVRLDRLECKALVTSLEECLLALPQTYMNRSGHAARCLVERHGFRCEDILVVFDDVALPLGAIRLRRRGSAGGHRGMESVIHSLRSQEIPRLRLGVEGRRVPAEHDLVDYVLSPFEADERQVVDAMIERAADACQLWLESGVDATMNRFNRA